MTAVLLTDRINALIKDAIEAKVDDSTEVVFQTWTEMVVWSCGRDGEEGCSCSDEMRPIFYLHMAMDCCEDHQMSSTMSAPMSHLTEGQSDGAITVTVHGMLDEMMFGYLAHHIEMDEEAGT